MISPRPIRNKTTRSSHEIPKVIGPGPYLAKVVGHLDKKFMGGLKVQLLNQSGNPDDDSVDAQTKIVQYASPFYGVTPNYAAGDEDSYRNTQQSYGFWAVPPDVGTLVLVSFVEGLDDFGFWFACVPQDFMNFMVPEPKASTANTSPATPSVYKGKKLPVGEYNVNKIDPAGQTQPNFYPRPVNPDAVLMLESQGLLEDDIRGVSSTSSRREVPSNVYGLSSPGPLDKRPNAPQAPKGTKEFEANMFSSRLGGSAFIIDDGDEKIVRRGHPANTPAEYANLEQNETGGDPTRPANELVRIRTRTGHQLLFHNTEDLIYIGNSRGTTWIEMTSNGKIDVFAQDSVSIHSQQDLNFAADRDINFTAYQGNINMIAGSELKADIGRGINFTAAEGIRSNAGEDISMNAASHFSVNAMENVSILSQASMSLLGKAECTFGSDGADTNIESPTAVRLYTDGDVHSLAKGNTYVTSFEGETHLSSSLKTSITANNVVDIASTEANVRLTAKNEMHIKSESNSYMQSGARLDINAAQSAYVTSASNINLLATGVVAADANEVHLNSGLARSANTATPANISRLAGQPTPPVPIVPIEPTHAEQVARVPQHEPWPQHENLNPNAYTPDRTKAGQQQVDSYAVPRSNGGSGVLPDTHLPPSKQAAAGTINDGYSPQFDNTLSGGQLPETIVPNANIGTISDPLTSAPGTITGFTSAQTLSFLNTIGQRESGNRYDAVNSIGFSGKYQFGKLALADRGYIKLDKVRSGTNKEVLENPANWTGKDGINSQQDWLAAPSVQEKVMIENTNANLNTLNRIGAITAGDSKETIMGMLAGAHLLGAGGIKKWRNGQGGADAYGSTGGEYFALGKAAFNGAAPNIENPNRLEQDEALQELYAQRQEQSGGPV